MPFNITSAAVEGRTHPSASVAQTPAPLRTVDPKHLTVCLHLYKTVRHSEVEGFVVDYRPETDDTTADSAAEVATVGLQVVRTGFAADEVTVNLAK